MALWAARAANAQPSPSPAELAAITERGRALAAYDRAVWHATDAVQMANPKTAQGQRAIARAENGKWRIVFGELDTEKAKFLIHYQADEGAKPQQFRVTPHEPPVEDAGFFLAAARALETATADFGRVTRPYSGAVLPAGDGQLYVYLYPAQVKAGVYPLGGDARYLVSAAGKIVERRQLHQTIIEGVPAKGKKAAAGFHRHVLNDSPEDTDVMHVLLQDPASPEAVGTTRAVYEIAADGSIRVTKQKK
jgi:hypothetical protein